MVAMEEINEAFEYTQNINVYEEGIKSEYSLGGNEFEKIICAWDELMEGAHPMPAFGVSLDKETRAALSRGLWVEFGFEKQMEVGGMNIEKLLVEVCDSFYGFNIIRYNTDYGYEGRCYYIDLVGKNMSDFSAVLKNLDN